MSEASSSPRPQRSPGAARTGAVEILFVSPSRTHATFVDRAVKSIGVGARLVAPTEQAVEAALGGREAGVFVVDATGEGNEWGALVRLLAKRYPDARIVILSEQADVAAVAKMSVVGAWNCLVTSASADEAGAILVEAAQRKPAADDTAFGRVRSRIPVSLDAANDCVMPSGVVARLAEVVEGCEAIGLTRQDLADRLQIGFDDLQALVGGGAVRRIELPIGPLFGSAIRPQLLGVAALVGAVWIGSWFLLPRAPRTYALRGQVSYRGVPLSSGEIDFDANEAGAKARSAVIRDGFFEMPAKRGLPRGKTFTVRVYGYRSTTKTFEGDGGAELPVQKQIVPERFNSQSELRFESSPANLDAGLTLDLQ